MRPKYDAVVYLLWYSGVESLQNVFLKIGNAHIIGIMGFLK